MGFFGDDDPFEDFFKNLTEDGVFEYSSDDSDGRRKTFRRHYNSRRIPARQVVTSDEVFFIFDFSGEEDVKVKIKDELVKNRYGEKVGTGKKILELSNKSENLGEYPLPDKIKVSNFKNTFKNGILEVSFKR